MREAVFYDKGYGYFRSCIDFRIEQGIEDDQIVELVKFIMAHGIKNSKEITQKMWIEWSKKHEWKNIREFMEGNDDVIYIPQADGVDEEEHQGQSRIDRRRGRRLPDRGGNSRVEAQSGGRNADLKIKSRRIE